MIYHHSFGNHGLMKKIFSVCIILALVLSISIPTFAEDAGDSSESNSAQQPAQEITDVSQPDEIQNTVETGEAQDTVGADEAQMEEDAIPADGEQKAEEQQTSEAETQEADVTYNKVSVEIVDSIAKDGCLTAKVTADGQSISVQELVNAGYTVTWYQGETPVEAKKITGDQFNAAPNGEWVNVALDSGAQKTYTVQIAKNGETQAISGEKKVDYYDSLQNGSFETPAAGDYSTYEPHVPSGEQGIVWRTTGTVGEQQLDHIELVSTSPNKHVETPSYGNVYITHKTAAGKYHNMDHTNTANAGSGTQYAEINAESAGALYQDVLTTPGANMNWSVDHNGRDGTDKMAVVIMATKDAESITTQDQLLQAIQDIQSGKYPGASVTTDLEGYQGSWTTHSGNYTVPAGQYLTRYFFVAISTSKNDPKVGNHIDNVWFSTELPPVNPGKGRVNVVKKVYGLSEEEAQKVLAEGLIQYSTVSVSAAGSAKLQQGSTLKTDSEGKQYYEAKYVVDGLSIPANNTLDVTVSEDSALANVEGYNCATTIDPADGKVTLKDTTDQEKTITVTNSYTPKNINLTIEKIVKGNMGDRVKSFTFTYTDLSGTERTVTLKSGESRVITVPIGTDFTVKETNAQGYKTSAQYGNTPVSVTNGEATTEAEKIITFTVTTDANKLVITNEKDAIPDTGLHLTSLPYIIMLALAAGGAIAFFIRRRHRI